MKDLRRDPLILRDQYARQAIRHSVRTGLEEYGDDFALIPTEYDHSRDDHPWVDEAADETLSEVFESSTLPTIDEQQDTEVASDAEIEPETVAEIDAAVAGEIALDGSAADGAATGDISGTPPRN